MAFPDKIATWAKNADIRAESQVNTVSLELFLHFWKLSKLSAISIWLFWQVHLFGKHCPHTKWTFPSVISSSSQLWLATSQHDVVPFTRWPLNNWETLSCPHTNIFMFIHAGIPHRSYSKLLTYHGCPRGEGTGRFPCVITQAPDLNLMSLLKLGF